MYKAH